MVPARKQLLDGNVQLLRRVLKFADDDDRASEGFRFTAPVTHHVALRAWRALSRGDRAAAEATARLPSVADHVVLRFGAPGAAMSGLFSFNYMSSRTGLRAVTLFGRLTSQIEAMPQAES